MSTLRIFLADDHAVVREGLKAMINGQPGLEVVGEAANGLDALARVVELNPDVVVVDVSMPGLSGAQVTTRLKQTDPQRKILALTVHEDRGYLRALLEAGANGYLLKQSPPAEIIHAIRSVGAGGTYLDPTLPDGWSDRSWGVKSRPTQPMAA